MRGDLPSGTVTFLFTDVEGSTKLLHELGPEGYAAALAEHRRVLRDAFTRHGGVEVDTQGDAFFVAFRTAPGAIAAALEAQHELAVPVRMAIHTGTPHLAEEGYVGPDVNRAARIAACGHGGQVLVSASTAQLVELELRDLGEHRFKDLAAPERVYQLAGGDFPPLKSLYRTNLPVPAAPFLGRERELAEPARARSPSEAVAHARLVVRVRREETKGRPEAALRAWTGPLLSRRRLRDPERSRRWCPASSDAGAGSCSAPPVRGSGSDRPPRSGRTG
ncbi:MAG: adenylate/guanylate cyclase domain-containing protein [Gaiellaceae bacterium]